ncbi:hypothetical protein FRX31_023132, partial [Thalictrum thalictroides]
SPRFESMEHLFLHSELAAKVWNHFYSIFNLHRPIVHNIGQMLSKWFKIGKKGSMEYMCYTLTPLISLWEIWKERCSRIYEEDHQKKDPAVIFKIRFWIIRISE